MDNIKGITNCTQCGRGCHVSFLMCGRGRRFFELLQNEGAVEASEAGEKKGCCGGHHHHHGEGHSCGCGAHKPHGSGLSELIVKCGQYVAQNGKGRGQGKVLKILARNGEMTQKDLQDMMEIQAGSLSEVLAKLEEKGFITRAKSEDDKRMGVLSITELGREKMDTFGCRQRAERLYGALSEEEKEQLKALLKKMSDSWTEE